MNIIEHVQLKAKSKGFVLIPTLGQSYLICISFGYKPFLDNLFKGSLYQCNRVLNQINT